MAREALELHAAARCKIWCDPCNECEEQLKRCAALAQEVLRLRHSLERLRMKQGVGAGWNDERNAIIDEALGRRIYQPDTGCGG